MARGTGQGGMGPSKCISGVFQVVKLGVEPRVHAVAAFASRRQFQGNVIEHWRQKVLLMAGIACG